MFAQSYRGLLQNPTPYIAIIAKSAWHPIVHLLDCQDWRRRPGRPRARWTDQLRNDTGSVPANLWRQTGYSTGPWWSDATARAGYAMTTTTTSLIAKLSRTCYGELTPYALLNSSVLRRLQKQDDDEDKS